MKPIVLKKTRKRRRHDEDNLQTQIADYLRAQYPELLWFHVPNGGQRNPIEGARFKRMGVLAGVADLLFYWNGRYGAIELKAGSNTQEPTQKLFQQRFIHTGGQYALCRSLDEVIRVIESWGISKGRAHA